MFEDGTCPGSLRYDRNENTGIALDRILRRNVDAAIIFRRYIRTEYRSRSGITADPDKPDDLMSVITRLFFPNGGNEHRYISPLRAKDEELSGLSPALFVLCGPDELKPMGIAYAKRLIDRAVPVKIKEYPEALHGFLEVNRPDYPAGDARQNPEQEAYCKDCEKYLVRELQAFFAAV